MDQELLTSLVKIAKQHKFAGWGSVSHITAKPFQAAGEGLARVFFGSKATKGVMKGQRKVSAGMSNINRDQYHKLLRDKAQNVKGTPGVTSSRTPSGKHVYQKEKYRYGGLVGQAQKHPVITAGIAGGGYLLAKAPQPQRVTNNNYYAQQQQQQQQQQPSNPNWG